MEGDAACGRELEPGEFEGPFQPIFQTYKAGLVVLLIDFVTHLGILVLNTSHKFLFSCMFIVLGIRSALSASQVMPHAVCF